MSAFTSRLSNCSIKASYVNMFHPRLPSIRWLISSPCAVGFNSVHVTIEQFDAAVPDRVTDFNSPGEAITFVRNTGLFLGFMFFLELRVEFLAKPCLILVLI